MAIERPENQTYNTVCYHNNFYLIKPITITFFIFVVSSVEFLAVCYECSALFSCVWILEYCYLYSHMENYLISVYC